MTPLQSPALDVVAVLRMDIGLDPAAASRVQLPHGDWRTVLECLCGHFPRIAPEQWRQRMVDGRVCNAQGRPLHPAQPYRVGMEIRYWREVPDEVPVPFREAILHQDDHLLVADKPHFLPVVPSGRHVEHTLLARLRRRTGNPDLVPLHRIDRATAGLVLFSTNRQSRGCYQQGLFQQRRIGKEYEAIAPALPQAIFPLVRKSRLARGEPFFRMREVEGIPNSETRIDAISTKGDSWHYRLQPVTGRKHQLRVHMAALGAAIVNDDYYPELAAQRQGDDFDRPLRLLARRLSFRDPLSGTAREFTSQIAL